MIDCNLAVLLAERGLKITQVSKDTGISRTTLTALSNDYSGGVKFETINTLCHYLKVTPEHFFNYLPYEYTFENAYLDQDVLFAEIKISKYSASWTIGIYSDLTIDSSIPCTFVDGVFELMYSADPENAAEDDQSIREFEKMYALMTPRQKSRLKRSISSEVKELIQGEIAVRHKLSLNDEVLSKDFDSNLSFDFID